MATKKLGPLQRLFGSIAGSEPGGLAATDAIGPALATKYGLGDYDSLAPEAAEALFKDHAEDYKNILAKMQKNPLAWSIPIEQGSDVKVSPLKTMGKGVWGNVRLHPWQTAGTALNATGNITGLVDNDKLLGQILGTAGGALLASKGLKLGPLGIANVAMGGGNLGMLFDKLRSKKAQEEQYQQQYM